jgi:hypothetical protein
MVQETDGNGDETGRSKKRSRAIKRIPTKLIHRDGKVVLVEWRDGDELRRGIIPAEARKTNDVAEDVLDAALTWGADWMQVEGVTPELVAALHDTGIWTEADMLAHSKQARGAIQKVHVVPLISSLLRFARTNK